MLVFYFNFFKRNVLGDGLKIEGGGEKGVFVCIFVTGRKVGGGGEGGKGKGQVGEKKGYTNMVAKMRYVLYPIEEKDTGVIITTNSPGRCLVFLSV